MIAERTVVTLLRIACLLTIAMGFIGIASGIVTVGVIRMFGVPIPWWVLGSVVTCVGVYYYARLKDVEKRIKVSM